MPGIRDKHRKTVIGIFTGEEFHIRKIKPTEFMQVIGAMPTETSPHLAAQLIAMEASMSKALKEKKDDPDFEKLVRDFYLSKGVTSPPIFFGGYDDCPEDHIHVDDLGDDQSILINAISEFSFGLTEFKKKMEQISLNQQSYLAGHAGEEVRETPDGNPANGNGV
jgi:hypothetical protein